MLSLFSSVASRGLGIPTCVQGGVTHCKHWFWVRLALITFIATSTTAVDKKITQQYTLTYFCFFGEILSLFTARCTLVQSAVLRSYIVRPSVRLSVTFRYRDHIGWNSSKMISRPNSLRPLLCLTPTWAIWCNVNTPKIGWNRGGVTRERKKPAISPKRCKIGLRLLLRTNRKAYTRFRFVPKSVTLNNLERHIQGLHKVFKYALLSQERVKPVSYTHLTLPTKRIV